MNLLSKDNSHMLQNRFNTINFIHFHHTLCILEDVAVAFAGNGGKHKNQLTCKWFKTDNKLKKNEANLSCRKIHSEHKMIKEGNTIIIQSTVSG